MAKVALELGAELEVVTPHELRREILGLEGRLKAAMVPRTIASQPATTAAGVWSFLNFGIVPRNARWRIRRVTVLEIPDPTIPSIVSSYAYFQGNPAAGTDFTITVPAGEVWTLGSVRAVLATSATVATRQPLVIIDDGLGHTLWDDQISAGNGEPASSTVAYEWGAGWGSSTLSEAAISTLAHVLVPLPMLTLGGGFRIRATTFNLQVGDQWSGLAVAANRQGLAAVGAGTVLMAKGQADFNIAAGEKIIPTDVFDEATGLPVTRLYGDNVIARGDEQFYVGLSGFPAGISAIATAQIEETTEGVPAPA